VKSYSELKLERVREGFNMMDRQRDDWQVLLAYGQHMNREFKQVLTGPTSPQEAMAFPSELLVRNLIHFLHSVKSLPFSIQLQLAEASPSTFHNQNLGLLEI
jgi:hypothetical protein